MTGLNKPADFDISIVIPALNADAYIPDLLKSIEAQTLPPKEIVIVDSSPTNRTAEIVENWIGPVPIQYRKVNFAYPGDARNIGVKTAQCGWIAFIDCRTLPSADWLERCSVAAYEGDADVVIALRVSEADTYFKHVLCAATTGYASHESLAGSLIRKDFFERSQGFISDLRNGEDIEWMQRLESLGCKVTQLPAPAIKYQGFPDNLIAAMKKWYQYSMFIVNHEIRNDQKRLYFLILILVLSLLFLIVFKWNAVMANWDSSSVYFVPNITKKFVLIILMSYVLFVGIVRPLTREVKLSFLFPWNWLAIAFVRFCLDLAKAPGLIWGTMLLFKRKLLRVPS